MKLSLRLKSIASYVDKNEIVADIGCDHAQLCTYLVKEGIVSKAYACDIGEGPLAQAKKTIEYYNLENHIETVLCDGLSNVKEDVTTIVIAGMGYETLIHILNNDLDKLHNKKIIVQINKDVDKLRKWISDHNFKILNEQVIREEHYYQIIVFNTEYDICLEEDELLFGRKMLKDDSFYSLWKFTLSKYEKILHQISDKSKYNEVFNKMVQIYKQFGS